MALFQRSLKNLLTGIRYLSNHDRSLNETTIKEMTEDTFRHSTLQRVPGCDSL